MPGNTVEIIIKGSDQASRAISSASGSLGGLGRSLTTAGSQMMRLGGAITAGVTGPLALIGGAAANAAGDFEAAMNVLGIAARSSGTAMGDLSKAAIQVGADTDLVGIDAMEAADAMTTFYKAGLDTTDIFGDLQGYISGTTPLMGALRASIDLAAASDIDLAEASDAVAVAMATFGLSAEDAAGIADSFVGAADASIAEVSDLTEALKNIGPTMAQFGYSLGDTNTALALLSTRGISGAEAGTALKSMMVNLMRQTSDVQDTLADLNVTLYDENGALKPLPQIIDELGSAMSGLSEEQKNQTIQTLAGSYGMKAMATLLSEGKSGWDAMAQSIDSAASAQEVAGVRTQGFNAAVEQLKGAIQTFMITVGTPLIQNVLTPLVQKLQGVIERLVELDPKFLNIGLVIAGVVAAAGPLLVALGAIVSAVGLLLSPIGLVIAAIVALALAFSTNFLGIRDLVTEVWGKIYLAIQTAIDLILPYVQAFITTISTWWNEHWPAIQATFETVWNAIWTIVQTVVGLVTGFIWTEFGEIILWLQENWPLIQQTIETVLNAVWSVIQTVVGWIAGFWNEHQTAILTVAQSVWNTIQTTIDTVIHVIMDIIKAVMQLITGDWEGAWQTIQDAAALIWGALQTIWRDAMNAIKAVVDEILPAIRDFWQSIWNRISEILTGVLDAISGKVTEVTGAIQTRISDVFNAVKDFWTTHWGKMNEILGNALSAFWDKVFRSTGSLRTRITDTFNAVKDFWKEVWGKMNEILGSALSSFWDKTFRSTGAIRTRITDTFNAVKDFFKTVWGQIWDIFRTSFENMVTGAGNFGRDIITALKEAMGSVKLPIPTFRIVWREGPMGVKIPDIDIGVNWRALRDMVAWLAEGGIVTRPTLAVLGERGPEAVVPLSGGRQQTGVRFDYRAIALLTEIRDLLAEGSGKGTGQFIAGDLLWDLQAAKT